VPTRRELGTRKSRFSEAQIVEILKQGDGAMPVAEIVRQHGISRGTYIKWWSEAKTEQVLSDWSDKGEVPDLRTVLRRRASRLQRD
jgi:DNA invertase Pin-like site-specific DNA recombinase